MRFANQLALAKTLGLPTLALTMVLSDGAAFAEVAPTHWPTVIEQATVIVIATELRIEEQTFEDVTWKVGIARVETLLAGPRIETVRYVAEPTWTCDISTAEPGSRVMLFLVGDPPLDPRAQPLSIAWSGYGRVPISEEGTVLLCNEFPKSLKRQALSRDRWGCIEVRLEAFVEEIEKRRATPTEERP